MTNLLTAVETARLLRISRHALSDRTAPRGPLPCVRFGRRVLYDPEALRKWLNSQQTEERVAC